MTLRKILPAALLLLAACTASTATETSTASVGMDPGAKKASCCDKMGKDCSAEQKAGCEKSGMDCSKPAEPAAKP
jgi:hypothetical protein